MPSFSQTTSYQYQLMLLLDEDLEFWIVPRDPLSILVVSLALVIGTPFLIDTPLISSMFDFNYFIHMARILTLLDLDEYLGFPTYKT